MSLSRAVCGAQEMIVRDASDILKLFVRSRQAKALTALYIIITGTLKYSISMHNLYTGST